MAKTQAELVAAIRKIIGELTDLAFELPTLPEVSDADMAILYCRHCAQQLEVSQ